MQHVVRTSLRSDSRCRRVETSCSRCLPCATNWPSVTRSNRRFRPSDRLLWLILRRVWPRWRDALVLVQPATVDRWHRDRFVRRWWRRSRRPGRPRIDSPCRDLIGRLADENRLWGAPRIHGELLKLGVVVSERTVSRYLRERPKRPSQTWRTFIANHLGQFAFNTAMLSPYVSGDDLVDASPVRVAQFRPTGCLRRGNARCQMGVPRPDAHVLAYLALRITFATARACEGAPAGLRRGLDCLQPTTAGAVKVDSFRSTGQTATVDQRETVARRRSRSVQTSSGREPSSFGLRWERLRG